MRYRPGILVSLCALLLGGGALLCVRPALLSPKAPPSYAPSPTTPALARRPPQLPAGATELSSTPPPSTPTAPPTPPPTPTPAHPPGVTGIWHGRFPLTLREFIARQDPDAPVPSRIELPVNDRERIAVRFNRIDFNGPDAATLLGEAEGRPGGTVVLSHVGKSQAGVIYLPEEKRSFVISGGEDGSVRVTATDLTRAPGCAPESLRPPLALVSPLPVRPPP